MRSYRICSVLQALAYVLLVASLQLHPPGDITSIVSNGHTIEVPTHDTFFQQIEAGTALWIVFFGIGAVWLLVAAVCAPRALVIGHAAMMTVTFSFGSGYVLGEIQLGAGWTTGALSLACAAGHALALRARPMTVASDLHGDYKSAGP